jgi:hypothetical protein
MNFKNASFMFLLELFNEEQRIEKINLAKGT